MKLMLVMILMMNVLFMQASHPVALMMMILAQTLLCCLMLMSLNTTSWFSFILFLIFLGGLMVLFIYISSLASNEKFSIKLNKVPFPLIMLLLTGTLMIYSVNNQTPSFSLTNEVKLLTNMYTTNIMNPTLMTMLYLLLTLVVVVKMTSKYEGPLRNMIYK